MSTTRIWWTNWQMDCCGDSIAVGQRAEWHLRPADDDPDGLERRLTSTWAGLVDYTQENCMWPEGVIHADGVVRFVQAVYRMADEVWVTALQEASGFERDPSGLEYLGYLVEVDDLTAKEPNSLHPSSSTS